MGQSRKGAETPPHLKHLKRQFELDDLRKKEAAEKEAAYKEKEDDLDDL